MKVCLSSNFFFVILFFNERVTFNNYQQGISLQRKTLAKQASYFNLYTNQPSEPTKNEDSVIYLWMVYLPTLASQMGHISFPSLVCCP